MGGDYLKHGLPYGALAQKYRVKRQSCQPFFLVFSKAAAFSNRNYAEMQCPRKPVERKIYLAHYTSNTMVWLTNFPLNGVRLELTLWKNRTIDIGEAG